MPRVPELNLPPQSAEGGRYIMRELARLSRDASRTQTAQQAANSGLTAAINGLTRQIGDLSGRESYSTSSTDSNTWTTTQSANQGYGPTLAFTIDRPRVVSLEFVISGHVSVSSLGTASGFVNLRPCIFIDNTIVGPTQPDLQVVMVGDGAELSAPVSARALVSLGAGTYSARGGFALRQVTTTSGSGLLGILDVANPQLYVDVLQPA